ncbi:MAG TPA: NAD-dependent protein deacetylase [Nitriliruptoraceae bacterium]|nr:NAD-dependent protein deacetylase [Nitriliruptoraceae bacterium]
MSIRPAPLPPLARAPDRGSLPDLHALVDDGAAVLTGAGISTASGIPDYRGATGRLRPSTPMTHRDFVGSATNRQRYWARALVGWQSFGRTEPNPGHTAVASLQATGRVGTVITQNVDGLHQQGGARDVVELHGSLWRIRCLDCTGMHPRTWLQRELAARNPDWRDRRGDTLADGDAAIADTAGFEVVGCPDCDGVLMPDVVFFGAGVRRDIVEACYRAVEQAPALIVLGSSLHVWSGLRFVRRAAEVGRPIAIVNHGPTRADDLATVRLDADLCQVLPRLAGDTTSMGTASFRAGSPSPGQVSAP